MNQVDQNTLNAVKKLNKKENNKTTETTENKNENENLFLPISEIFDETKNEVKLGKNKIIHITPWVGKTKKKIKKIFEHIENPNDINFNKLLDVLLYEHIQEDVFLNEGEQLLLLSILKKISVSETIESESECPVCQRQNLIKSTIDNITHYKTNNLPVKLNKEIQNKKIMLIDIKNKKDLLNIINDIIESEEYDGVTKDEDIALAMHISIENYTINQIIDFLDNLTIKELDYILNNLQKYLPMCELKEKRICKYCDSEVDFNIEITSDIIQDLIQ